MKRVLLFLTPLLLVVDLSAVEEYMVKITKDLPYFYTYHKGKRVKVHRIQETSHRLSDDYTKTSRECPPFCIHPVTITKSVKTIGELEFIEYMRSKDALIVDARLKGWYQSETIPSSVNIPYNIFDNASKKRVEKILGYLGRDKDGNFTNAKTLAIFCNGIWCDQSPRLIKKLISYGYPPQKLKYYRGGFQAWKLFGLTTVIEKQKSGDTDE